MVAALLWEKRSSAPSLPRCCAGSTRALSQRQPQCVTSRRDESAVRSFVRSSGAAAPAIGPRSNIIVIVLRLIQIFSF